MSAVTLFNRYAEHIMRNAGLDELQTGIKIGRSKINPRYVDDTTLKAESKKELKSLLMRLREESERASLKLNIKITKIMASGPVTSWQIEGEGQSSDRFPLLGSEVTAGGDCSHEIRR